MTVDASTRGRRNRANGAWAEREVARWLKGWYPDACRAVRNTHPDPGDIDCTSPGLYWSIKNTQVEHIPAWLAEMDAKRGERIGLLVVRRKGHASPYEWWCWLRLSDLTHLTGNVTFPLVSIPVRMELGHVMGLLVYANYATEVAA